MNKGQLFWITAALLALASMGLPWWESASEPPSNITLVLLLVGALLTLLGSLKQRARQIAVVLVITGTALGLVEASSAQSPLSWGFYLAAIVSAMMLIGLKSRAFVTTPYYAGRTSFKMPRLHVPSVGRMKHYYITVGGRNLGLTLAALTNLIVGLISLTGVVTAVVNYAITETDFGFFTLFGVLSIFFALALWRRRRWSPSVVLLIIVLLLVYLGMNIEFTNVLDTAPIVLLFEGVCYIYARKLV